jgi:hypothetical protein
MYAGLLPVSVTMPDISGQRSLCMPPRSLPPNVTSYERPAEYLGGYCGRDTSVWRPELIEVATLQTYRHGELLSPSWDLRLP